MMDTIRGRQMMIAMGLGLLPEDLPDESRLKAEALAWIEFQRQFPKVKISPQTAAILGVMGTSSLSYRSMAGKAIERLRTKAQAARQAARPGFNVPAVNPADRPAPHAANDIPPTVRATPTGSEIVMASGVVPDGGKLKFD